MPVFARFHTIAPMPDAVFDRYGEQVGPEISAMWREHGVGFVDDGFLRVVDPIWFEDTGFVSVKSGVPIFLTALCDTICFIPDTESFTALKLRFGAMDIVSNFGEPVGDALASFADPQWRRRVLEDAHFTEAIATQGVPSFEEGFGYVPSLLIGGPHRASTLEPGKAVVTQNLLAQMESPQMRNYLPDTIEFTPDS